MACFPWILPEAQGQDIGDFPNVGAWHARIKARAAVVRAYEQGARVQAQPVEMSDEQRRVLFGQTAR